MPINVNAFTGATHTNCACYKCRVRNAAAGFATWYAALPGQFGGTLPLGYKLSDPLSALTLEQMETVKHAVSQVLKFNEDKLNSSTALQKSRLVYCFDCGKAHIKDNNRRTNVNWQLHYLCSECARTKYRLCCTCHLYKQRLGFKRHADLYYCSECFHRLFYLCSRCDRVFALGNEHRFLFQGDQNREYTLCPSCKENLRSCRVCGHHFFDSLQAFTDRRGQCAQCFLNKSSIRNYSFKPAARWRTNVKLEKFRGDTLFAGFEWELENRSGRSSTDTRSLSHELQADKISSTLEDGLVYFKQDGSLSNGFEVVTHPFTWQFYHDHRENFITMVEEAYRNGMRAERSCGFHIHMSKPAFSYGQLYKFVKFIYANENAEFIDTVSERPQRSSYAAFRESDRDKSVKFAKRKCNCSEDRHSAINATGNRTVEVRFFASTIKPLSLLKNIEFVFALYEYTNVCSYKQCTAADFLAWLATRPVANKYRNLVTWIKKSSINESMQRKFRKQLKKNKANLNLKKGE